MILMVFVETNVKEFTFSVLMRHVIGERRIHGGTATMPPDSMRWLV